MLERQGQGRACDFESADATVAFIVDGLSGVEVWKAERERERNEEHECVGVLNFFFSSFLWEASERAANRESSRASEIEVALVERASSTR